jgi:hypothetical protein
VNLLVFAHRGEAQSFIKHFQLEPFPFIHNGLFKKSSYYLLITGEGFKEASEKVVSFLATHHHEIKNVYNIGIAGGLNPKMTLGDCLWIRGSLAYNSEKCEFKTYQSLFHNKVDCITSYSRVLSKEEKIKLSLFADIVDRELYGVMSAAHLFKIPSFGLKLISDNLSSVDQNENLCFDIQSQASEFSEKLLSSFLQSIKDNETKLSHLKNAPKRTTAGNMVLSPSLLEPIINDDRFHFTVSQERKLNQLLSGLEVKKKCDSQMIFELLEHFFLSRDEKKSPKDAAKDFIIMLDEILHPFNIKVKKSIEEALTPFTENGFQAHYDQELEDPTVTVTFKIKSTKELKKAQFALDQFKYYKIENIFNGQFEDDV